MRAAGAMEEVPCPQPALLFLHDQKALTAQDEKTFLGVLTVVHAHRLAGFENADVDPKLRKPPLAFEGAVAAEGPSFLQRDSRAFTTNQPSPSTTRPFLLIRSGASRVTTDSLAPVSG